MTRYAVVRIAKSQEATSDATLTKTPKKGEHS